MFEVSQLHSHPSADLEPRATFPPISSLGIHDRSSVQPYLVYAFFVLGPDTSNYVRGCSDLAIDTVSHRSAALTNGARILDLRALCTFLGLLIQCGRKRGMRETYVRGLFDPQILKSYHRPIGYSLKKMWRAMATHYTYSAICHSCDYPGCASMSTLMPESLAELLVVVGFYVPRFSVRFILLHGLHGSMLPPVRLDRNGLVSFSCIRLRLGGCGTPERCESI